MRIQLHEGITENPHATLPNGTAEIGMRDLLRQVGNPKVLWDQIRYKLERRRLNRTPAGQRREADAPSLLPLLAELLELLQQKSAERPVTAVMAPWWEDPTLTKSEGYIRRIKEIDRRVLGNVFCIYFYECPYYKVDRIVADRVGENRIYIRYNTAYKAQREFVESLIGACPVCYSHSVLRLIPAEEPENVSRWLNLFDGPTRHVLDAHGAVVEEALVQNETESSEYCARAENLYFKHISSCIVLTTAMQRYFDQKYDCGGISFYRTPVLSEDIASNADALRKQDQVLRAVYAGGCQKWQNIELLQQAISSRPQVDYRIFVSSPERFWELWGDRPLPPNLTVKNGTPEEIRECYCGAHYGFILRDDNALNRVACPTKIMEYIQFGVLPVVKSRLIGDFEELGLHMIPVNNFKSGILPDDDRRKQMAEENLQIAERLKSEYASAIQQLKRCFGG